MARRGGLVEQARRALGQFEELRADSTRRRALDGLDALQLRRGNAAETTAAAVREAVLDAPLEVPVPPEIYGPLEVVATMAAPVLARRWGLPGSEEDLERITWCLIDTWTQELALSTREHYEAWLATRNPAGASH